MSRMCTVGKTATSIAASEGKTRITYHSTVVVAFDEHSVTLDSGGWRTATTKTRMNQASNQFDLGFCVSQRDFCWFVSTPAGETLPFEDGMTFPR